MFPKIALILLMPLHLLMGQKIREGTEWDTAYWHNANDDKLPRVLLVGDSICNQYADLVRNNLAGVAYVAYWATSKCVTDRSYLKQLSYILEEYPYAVVHFNNGLHSLDTNRAQWEAGLKPALALKGMVGSHNATERQWESAISGLREFCDRAPKIEFCLECHEGVLMDSSPATLRLLRNIDRPNVSTNLQLPLASEEWEETVEQLGPYTTHMHLHNWRRGLGCGELTFLGQGAFDWRPVTRRLLEMGRSVCLSVEHADHNGRHNPWNTATHDGRFLSALCEECGALK